MEIKEYGRNSKKKKKTSILKRLENIFFWLGVSSIIVLIALLFNRFTNKPQPSPRLNEKAIQQYELQREHLISLTKLANSPAVHSFFADLLTTYAEKFAESKKFDTSHLPLAFEGLYSDQKIGNGMGTMGQCIPRQVIYPYHTKEINIRLNHLYLLNKFGHDRYFTSHPKQGDYYYLDISFGSMIKTCSHELAHYIQFVKWGVSSCESDLKLGRKEYNPELAEEHEEFTQEIYQLIKNSGEYLEWEKIWKEIV